MVPVFLRPLADRFKRTALYEALDRYLQRYPRYFRYRYRKEWVFRDESIAILTIDSLRYDVAIAANTPHFQKLFGEIGVNGWVKVGAHGTHTLASHISMLHGGIFPCDNRPDVPPPYNRTRVKLFKPLLAWERKSQQQIFPVPEAPNIVKGFEKLRYRTVGIGGVHWFDTTFQTSSLWGRHYFREFYWRPEFDEDHPDSLQRQIALLRQLNLPDERRPVFFFLNISCTHRPYMGFGESVQGQQKAFEHVDSLLPEILRLLPRDCHLMILADHGDCFGEDGLWGHTFYHPKVMEVPFVIGKRKSV